MSINDQNGNVTSNQAHAGQAICVSELNFHRLLEMAQDAYDHDEDHPCESIFK